MNLGRAATAGAASGLRTSVAVAALLEERARFGKLARLGVAVELVIDKLPSTPSRLRPGGLAARLAAAAIAGAVIGRSASSVLVAASSAALSARVGHDLRVEASKHAPQFAVAVAEDLVALALARA